MNEKKFFIIDFDSTFIQYEGLDELASLALQKNPDRDRIVSAIKQITADGMEGKIPFQESLSQRVALLHANKAHIDKLVRKLKTKVTPSILRNKKFFKKYRDIIYIVSGGFKEFILPIAENMGIPKDHVLANTFEFDTQGNIVGFDKKNPLVKQGGKIKAVQGLKLKGKVTVLGDGHTDYAIKEQGVAQEFIAFTENIRRETVLSHADRVAPTFDEFLYINKLPMTISYPKNRINVLLVENIDNEAVTILEKEGYSVEYHTKSLPEEQLLEKIKKTYVLGIRSRTQVTQDVLSHAPRLLAVGAYCIGTDQIDLQNAAQQGITVFNAPYSNTRSVVELVIGEIIMLMRGVIDKNTKLHTGIWDKSAVGNYEVRGKTLGIIGYGNIGSQLSVLAEALGLQVYFYDIVEKLALGNAKRCRSMTELLRISDIVTIHVDGNPKNYNLISEKEFGAMKDGALFLNLSRGKIVDIDALVKYLKSGKLSGAAIDVFPKEPKSKDEPFVSKLQGLPNVILTPHIGGSTVEAQKNIAIYVSNKIIEYINTGNTYLSVNVPNIQLPAQKNHHRLLHLHKNVPGILAQINGILAENKINILDQYLKTNEKIGYVITDVNKKYDKQVLEKLKTIQDTIRFRVLY